MLKPSAAGISAIENIKAMKDGSEGERRPAAPFLVEEGEAAPPEPEGEDVPVATLSWYRPQLLYEWVGEGLSLPWLGSVGVV